MAHFFKKAMADIRSNQFLNLITIITIALSILVVSVFLLFFENASRVIESWNQGGRAMVYLVDTFSHDQLSMLEARLNGLGAISEMTFIPKDDALAKLRSDLSQRTSFLKTLEGNPLPDAVEVKIKSDGTFEHIEKIARDIKNIDLVDDVEYGQGWLGKFLNVFNLFKITGYAMCSLFFLIALFITANTVRLAFYSRRMEVEIMRLVGATETFIKTPFYVEGFLQGLLGGILGLIILFVSYLMISSGITRNFATYIYFDIYFLSLKTILFIVLGSSFLGWFGCYISLKQILR